jgi:hypothetical protein
MPDHTRHQWQCGRLATTRCSVPLPPLLFDVTPGPSESRTPIRWLRPHCDWGREYTLRWVHTSVGTHFGCLHVPSDSPRTCLAAQVFPDVAIGSLVSLPGVLTSKASSCTMIQLDSHTWAAICGGAGGRLILRQDCSVREGGSMAIPSDVEAATNTDGLATPYAPGWFDRFSGWVD